MLITVLVSGNKQVGTDNKVETKEVLSMVFMSKKESERTNRENDLEIVRGFLAGDIEAVKTVEEWILQALWPYQRRLASRWVDVGQDVRLEVTRLLAEGRFSGESRLRTYLWRTVSHTCLEAIREIKQQPDLDDTENPNYIVREYVDQETSEVQGDSRQEGGNFLRAIGNVSQDCRELLRMLLTGMSYSEISAETGIAEGTLRITALRCRERVEMLKRELLALQGEENATKVRAVKTQNGRDVRKKKGLNGESNGRATRCRPGRGAKHFSRALRPVRGTSPQSTRSD